MNPNAGTGNATHLQAVPFTLNDFNVTLTNPDENGQSTGSITLIGTPTLTPAQGDLLTILSTEIPVPSTQFSNTIGVNLNDVNQSFNQIGFTAALAELIGQATTLRFDPTDPQLQQTGGFDTRLPYLPPASFIKTNDTSPRQFEAIAQHDLISQITQGIQGSRSVNRDVYQVVGSNRLVNLDLQTNMVPWEFTASMLGEIANTLSVFVENKYQIPPDLMNVPRGTSADLTNNIFPWRIALSGTTYQINFIDGGVSSGKKVYVTNNTGNPTSQSFMLANGSNFVPNARANIADKTLSNVSAVSSGADVPAKSVVMNRAGTNFQGGNNAASLNIQTTAAGANAPSTRGGGGTLINGDIWVELTS